MAFVTGCRSSRVVSELPTPLPLRRRLRPSRRQSRRESLTAPQTLGVGCPTCGRSFQLQETVPLPRLTSPVSRVNPPDRLSRHIMVIVIGRVSEPPCLRLSSVHGVQDLRNVVCSVLSNDFASDEEKAAGPCVRPASPCRWNQSNRSTAPLQRHRCREWSPALASCPGCTSPSSTAPMHDALPTRREAPADANIPADCRCPFPGADYR